MKPLFSILYVFLFTGCFGIMPTFPKMERVEPVRLSWEDIRYKERNLHALTSQEWQEVQVELIDRRYKANICADIVNKYMEDYR
jgi:hypothetical protein